VRKALTLVAVLAGAVVAGQRNTGPWDLEALVREPAVEWLDREGTLRSLCYAGEPLAGKPTRIFAYYAVPEKRDGRVPAMVLVHGGGGKAFPEWATLWAKRGYAAIAMDLAGKGPDGKRLPDGMPDQGHQQKFLDISKGLKEAWPYHAVAAVIRAHSLLLAQPEVHPGRTGLTGISWGGYLTCIVAGLDDRFKLAVPVYGCGFLGDNSAWLGTFERLMKPADRKLWLATFDPSVYLPHATMPMLWVNGTNDHFYPLDSYQRSYRLPTGPRVLCITVRMPHGHQAGWRPVEIGLFADQQLRGGKPLATLGAMQVKGGEVTATVEAAVPIAKAAMHSTTDTGVWEKRKWATTPAQVADGAVRARLPAGRPLVFFVTVTDQRGAAASTEHAELPAQPTAGESSSATCAHVGPRKTRTGHTLWDRAAP